MLKHLDSVLLHAAKQEREWKDKLNQLILAGEPIAAFLKTRVGTFYDKEILKYVSGIEVTRNVVIDSTTVQVDSTSGRYVLEAGQLLVANAGASAEDAVQVVTLPVDPTEGSYQLVVPGSSGAAGGAGITAPISFDAADSEMQAALEALPDVGVGNVSVVLTPQDDGPPAVAGFYTITFQGRMAATLVPPLQVTNSTVDGTGSVSVSVTTAGKALDATGKVSPAAASGVNANTMVGILTHTVEFFYPVEPNVTDEPAAVYFHLCVFDTTKLLSVAGNLSACKTAFPTCRFE